MANQQRRDQILADLSRRAGRGIGTWALPGSADTAGTGTQAHEAGTDQPLMTAGEVQGLLTTPDGAPQVSGVGRSGSGAWYSAMRPGMAGIDYAALQAGAPGAYNNVYAPAMEQTLNQLLARQPFQYDVNADGLYQQIKDNYIKAGKQAMMDTQGQSAALTGGYGNSYAAQAGQQAYQESLGNLANAIPTLAQQAYAQYMDQGDQQRANLEAMRLLEDQDYSRWADEQARYQEFLQQMPALTAAGRGGGGYNGPQVIFAGGHPGAGGSGNSGNRLYSDAYMAGQQAAAAGLVMDGWDQVDNWDMPSFLAGYYSNGGVDTMTGAAPYGSSTGSGSGTGAGTGSGSGSGSGTGTGGTERKGTPAKKIHQYLQSL